MLYSKVCLLAALCMAFAVAPHLCAVELPPGASAHWRFDEGEGGVALDASGNERHGTLSSVYERRGKQYDVPPARVEGVRGKALGFRGMDGNFGPFVRIGQGREVASGQASVCLWMKLEGPWKSHGRLLTSRPERDSVGGWLNLSVFWLRINAAFGDGEGETVLTVQEEPSIVGHWMHVAFTHDGRKARLYLNGEQKGETEANGPLLPPSAPMVVGNYHYPTQPFRGALDEVVIYPRALTHEEVVQVMEATVDAD